MGSPAWEIINEIFVALERQQHLKPIMDVYDAAMALFEDGDGMIVTDSSDEPDASGTIYSSAKKIAALWEARCRAKEGR